MNRKNFLTALKRIKDKDLEILRNKNEDYANGSDPFQNFKMVENSGLCTVEKGILVRMSDKMQRIFNLVGNEDRETSVKDESVKDTLSDLRNYAAILEAYLESKNSQDKQTTEELNEVNTSPANYQW